jgi:hypothetical protein
MPITATLMVPDVGYKPMNNGRLEPREMAASGRVWRFGRHAVRGRPPTHDD